MEGKKKVAFITGITGQDGAYLADLLLGKGYRVIGGARRSAERSFWRLEKLKIMDKIEIVDFDLLDFHNMVEVIKKYQPDEFYNLAAQSFVGTSFRQPLYSLECNGLAVARILSILKDFSPETRFYQASTSEMFGDVREKVQNEYTPFNPVSPYGVAKLMAHNMVEYYRNSEKMFACSGILFNHESSLRGDEFVTKKITNWIRNFKNNPNIEPLELGNIYAKRDWGFSGDYVEAMWLMLQIDIPDSYVISTGQTYSVKDFIEMCFFEIGSAVYWMGEGLNEVGIDRNTGKEVIKISEKFYRPNDVQLLLGDCKKAKKALKWRPRTDIYNLVRMMVADSCY